MENISLEFCSRCY